MTPVIPLSMTNISLISGATFTLNKNNRFTRCSFSRRPVKRTSCSQKLLFPVPAFVTSFPRSGLLHKSIQIKLSATGTDVTVEEPGSPVLDEGSSGASETQADEGKTKETSPARSDASPVSAQSRRARPARKSEMPPVKNEDLIPGAVFTGKVRSIQPFGAFVDFGAFTDGLVHVSRLSDSFVKDVGSVVSIGQEVQVRLIEANTETGRISLSMRERDDPAKVQQQDSPATASTDKPRPPRRNTGRSNQRREEAKTSKFIKGQELEGTVKNLTRSGAFISLPEGEEGFLPSSEESDDGLGSMLGSSSLEVGQEVSVRVLRLSRGQVTLTMKKEEDESKLDTEFSQGVIHAATNPFVLAFRKNKDIAAFLDDREKVEEPKKKASEEVGSPANQTEVLSDVPEVQEQPAGSDAESLGASTEAAFADENADSETTLSEEKEEDSYAVLDLEGSASTVGESILETPSTDSAEKGDEADSSAEIDSEASFVESPITEEIVENQPTAGDEISSAALVEKDDAEATSDENGSVIRSDVQEDPASPQEAKDELENVESTVASVDSIEATVSPFESQDVEEIAEKQVETAQDDAKIQTPAAKNKTTVSENKAVQEVVMDQAEDIKEVQAQTPAAEAETTISEEKAVEESQVEDTKEEVQIQTPTAEKETTISENKSVQEVVMDQAEDFKEVQVQTPAAKAETTISKEKAIEEVVESQVADTKEEVQIQTPAAENETTVFENKAVQEVVADQAEDIKEILIQTHAVQAETTIYEEKAVEKVVESQVADTKEAQIQTPTSENETTISENKAVEEVVTDQAEDIKEVPVQTSTAEAESTISYEKAVEEVVDSQDGDTKEEVQIQTPAKKVESTQEKATKDEEDIVESTVASLDSREATILSSESQAVEEIAEKQVETAQEYAQIQTPSAEIETVVSESEAIQEVVTGQAKNFKEAQVQTPAAKAEITSFDERAVEEVVESQVGDTKKGVQIQAPTSENGTPEEVKSTLEKATKDEEETVPSTFASLDSSEATILSSESQAPEEIAVKKVETAQEDAQIQTPSAETETIVSENEAIQEVVTDQKENIKEVQVQKPAAEAETTSSDEKAVEEVVESQVGDSKEGVQIQTLTSENGTPEKVESTLENATKDEEETVESTIASLDSSEATILSTESQTLEEIAEKQVESAQEDAQIQTPSAETETIVSENEAVQEVVTDQAENIKEVQVQTPAAEAETTSSDEKAVKEVVESQVGDTKEGVQIQTLTSENGILEKLESTLENAAKVALQVVEEVVESQVEDTKEEVDIQTPAAVNGTPEKDESTPKSATKATISPALVKQLREETGAGMMDCKKALSETVGDIVKAQEYLRKKGLASAEKKASRATAEGRIGSYIHDSRIGVLVEVNCETDFVSRGEIFKELVDDIAMQVAACPQVQYLATEDVPEEFVNKEREIEMQKEDLASKPEQIRAKIVEGRIRKRLEELALLEQPYIKNDKVVIKDWVKQTIATIGENIKVKRYIRYNLGEGLEKKSQDFAAEVAAQTAAKPAPATVNKQPAAPEVKETEEKKPAVAVSAALVKQLREETGAGMMDCKKALSETGGDLEKAQEYLRKKGLSTADKKSSRLAAEGRIGAYIHDSRIGVLIEINCETDFVGRSENFKALVDDLAMQVVACPQVQFVSIEDIPEEIVKKEKELEMQREDLASKPENIREQIVEGRVSKRLGELTLLEQPFIKNDSILVKDLVKQTVAALGENIKVRRFVRFTLGETTEGEKAEKDHKGKERLVLVKNSLRLACKV